MSQNSPWASGISGMQSRSLRGYRESRTTSETTAKIQQISRPLTIEETSKQIQFWMKRVQSRREETVQEGPTAAELQTKRLGIYQCRGRIQGDYPTYLPENEVFTEKQVLNARMLIHHGGVLGTTAEETQQAGHQALSRLQFLQQETYQGLGWKALHPSKLLVWNTLVPSNTKPRHRLKKRHVSSYMPSLEPIALPEGCISSYCPICWQRSSSETSSDWSPEGVVQPKSTGTREILRASRTMAEESHERQAVALLDG